jgi:hypothetical protein
MYRLNTILIALCMLLLISTPSHADWAIWAQPETREVKPHQALRFNFGVSGAGNQRPGDFKVIIYSEMDSQLRSEAEQQGQFAIYAFTLMDDAPEDLFTRTDPKDPRKLIRKVEIETPFSSMYVTPESPGEKTITLILSYRTAGDQWATNSTQFHYYVPTWVERNERWLTLLAIILALIGLKWMDNILGKIWRRIRKGRSNQPDRETTQESASSSAP